MALGHTNTDESPKLSIRVDYDWILDAMWIDKARLRNKTSTTNEPINYTAVK